jgi:hypothetical protein
VTWHISISFYLILLSQRGRCKSDVTGLAHLLAIRSFHCRSVPVDLHNLGGKTDRLVHAAIEVFAVDTGWLVSLGLLVLAHISTSTSASSFCTCSTYLGEGYRNGRKEKKADLLLMRSSCLAFADGSV